MRVLHVIAGRLFGGVETLLATLARYRNLCPDMAPEFAVCYEGRLSEELAVAGVPVHRLGEVRIRNPISIVAARRRLHRIIRARQIDVVICHMSWAQAVFGPAVNHSDASLVFWSHLFTTGKHWLDRFASMTKPEIAICPSNYVAESLSTMYPNVQRHVLYYPVDLSSESPSPEERNALREGLATPRDAVVVMQACRMEPWKGQHLHLKALGRLRDVPNWMCWIVGGAQRPYEQSYFDSLKDLACAMRIDDRVRFLGQRTDVPRLLASGDIYCQPNLRPEGLPIVFAEAMNARLPIVTSNLGGFWELVDENCGMLVAPGEVDEFASSLRKLIEDEDSRRRMGGAGQKKIREQSDVHRQLPKLAAILAELLENQERRGSNYRPRSRALGFGGV